MNILSSKVDCHPDTFAPVVTAVIEFPLEAVVDRVALVGEDELAKIIGVEFISAWKRHKGVPE